MKRSLFKLATFAVSLVLGVSIGAAQTTVTVGPTGQYPSPCAAFPNLADGDTVQIDANGGTPYYDTTDCYVRNNNLTIVGVNGRPILDASKAGIAKGIWVIDGHDDVIDNFEFRNANTNGSSSNAAGLRIESSNGAGGSTPGGGNITVQRCYIHDNDDGILGANAGDGNGEWFSATPFITFQYDEFANNGFGDGETHNMYMGYGGDMNFTLQYSWTHDSYVGHTIKTRAPINNIRYNMIGDSVGNSSYLLNFPVGGSSYIVGNSIYKLATTNYYSNTAAMLYADVNDNGASDPEYAPPNQDLHFINNTMILDPLDQNYPGNVPPTFVLVGCFAAAYSDCPAPGSGAPLTTPAVVENNIFLGGETAAINQPSAFMENNLLYSNSSPSNLSALDFNNAAAFDYRLLPGSPAIGAGVYPPTDNTGAADPNALAQYEYSFPVNKVAWPTPTGSTMDAGAFSSAVPITAPNLTLTYTQTVQSPNTGTITVTGLPTPAAGQYNYASFLSGNESIIVGDSTDGANGEGDIDSVASTTGTVTTSFTVYPVAASTVVPIYVYVDGTVLTANVTVNPGPTALESVTLDSVYYPLTTTHLSGPGTSPVVVTLSSSDSSILYSPATVTIPAGQLSAENGTLNGGLNPPALSASAPVTLTASYGGKTVFLTTPIDSPGIHNFYCGVCTVTGGSPVGAGLIFAGYTPYGGATVTATSSNSAAIPNQSFPIAQGVNLTNISINTNAVTTSTPVTVTLGFNGQTSPLAITLTPSSAAIAAVSGSGQTAAVGTNFTNPLVVSVTNSGSPVSGATVTFAGAGVSFPAGNTAVTNSSGQAQVTAQPTGTGALTITASVAGAATPASFSETGTAGAPASVAAVSGSGQSAPIGSPFASPLVVVVKDSGSNPVSGTTVTFAGTGVSFPSGATAVTNSSGQAQVTAQPTSSGALIITASVAGVATPASFSETGTGTPASIAVVSGSGQSASSGTSFTNPLVVVVKDASSNPVPGATVTFAGSKASFPSGATAVTNSSGVAQVTAQPTTTGAIAITASVAGVSTPASFSETGTAGPVLKSITLDGTGPGTTVHLKAAATSPVVVNLSSSNSSVVTAPATVTVPTGASSAETGTLLGSLWAPADSGKSATLTAVLNGVTETLTATFYSPSLNSFACSPASCPAVVGGLPYNFKIELSGTAPVGGGTVQITSSNPAVIPNQIATIPAGQNTPTTSPVVINTNAVTATTTVTVMAAFNGTQISVGPITVNPAAEIKSVTSDSASSPGTTVNLTAAAPTGGLTVQITSSNQSVASAPATVTVPAGQTSAEIGTLLGTAFTPAGSSQSATISATYNSITKSVTKTYYSPTVSTFGCTTTPCPSVAGGQTLSLNLALSKSGAPVGGAVVTISSDTPSVVPTQTVTIAAGQNSPAATPVLINTNTVTKNTVVHVSASYNGSTKAATGGAITITPPLPPASIAVVSGSGQSSNIGTPFTSPLVVLVEDVNSNPVNNTTVTFAGAGVSFPSGATAVTNSSGQAQVTAQPTTAGPLTISASVTGVSTPATFSETGTTPVALSSITQDNNYQSGTTVHLTGAATSPVVVNLSTSDSSILYTPATVTVPTGQSTAETGTLLGSLWGQTPTSKPATLTAIYSGVTKTLTFNVDYTTIHSFGCPASLTGGQAGGCFLESAFNVAPYGGAPFTISSDTPSVIPTQSFTMPAGQGNDFNISLNTNAVSTSTVVNVTVNYNGATETTPITVTP